MRVYLTLSCALVRYCFGNYDIDDDRPSSTASSESTMVIAVLAFMIVRVVNNILLGFHNRFSKTVNRFKHCIVTKFRFDIYRIIKDRSSDLIGIQPDSGHIFT